MGKPSRARDLYDELRAQEARAKRACKKRGQKYSRREVASEAAGPKSALDRRLGEWLHEEWSSAKVPDPSSSEQLIAVVRVWSRMTGKPCDERWWRTLLVGAGHVRQPFVKAVS
jgi:hypothetical protein